jgi:hypothetical protein
VWEWLRNRHHHLHHRRHHHRHVILFVNGVGVVLDEQKENKLMLELTLGHGIAATLTVLDADLNPMLKPVAFASPPVWTQTTPATDTMIVSADGLSDNGTTVAVGTDSWTVTATLPGQTTPVTASLAITVDAKEQVPTSIRIDAVAV